MTDLADLTIAEAGEGFRRGDFSAVDVLEAVHRRAAITESHLHAYLTLDRSGSRAAAEAADAAFVANEDTGPLTGIPIALHPGRGDDLFVTDPRRVATPVRRHRGGPPP